MSTRRRAHIAKSWPRPVLAALVVIACGASTTPIDQPAPEGGPSGGRGGGLGGAKATGGSTGSGAGTSAGGSAAGESSDGAPGVDCNANRGPGIPINAGTLSAAVDGQTLSGDGTILWAAEKNTLNFQAPDGSVMTIVFPGCEAKSFSLPETGGTPDAISITYTAGGGSPQWVCTYEDTNPGAATCMVNVTAYGARQNSPVTGTFSGVLRPLGGSGLSTKSVTAGTFTFGRP